MRAACLALMPLLLLPAAAVAQTAPVTWTAFTDPTENAFGAEVPQGWTVTGGVMRFSVVDARQWLTAVSPDGMTQIFIGDPLLPSFDLPRRGQPPSRTVHHAVTRCLGQTIVSKSATIRGRIHLKKSRVDRSPRGLIARHP